jgi:hypothetical protein
MTGNTDCVTVGIIVRAISNRWLPVQPRQLEGRRELERQRLAVQVQQYLLQLDWM